MARDGVPVGPEFAAVVARVAGGEKVNVRAECAVLGVAPKTFYKYLRRFQAEGVEGFYPCSRRPLSSPSRLSASAEDLIVRARKELDGAGWDAGADQIRFWLSEPGHWPAGLGEELPSRATINRVLERRGQIVRVPQRRPRRSIHRFEADRPNSMWQMDGFGHTLAGGPRVVILQITDDCSRYDLALRAVVSENALDVWAAVLWASRRYGLPARFLTDNGTSFSGARRGWISPLEQNLRALGVQPITSSIAHPQTCGKNERAHATVQKWLRRQDPAENLEELQAQLDTYREHYNHHRRKTHLDGMTPAERYALGPHDGPGTHPVPWPVQITTAKVSASGCIGIDKHLLGVGRRHTGQTVTVIRQHRQIAVFKTNDLLAEFTLTGHRGYQPKDHAKAP
jgi:transposase InsO family protein